jgi:hypothetical protein
VYNLISKDSHHTTYCLILNRLNNDFSTKVRQIKAAGLSVQALKVMEKQIMEAVSRIYMGPNFLIKPMELG